MRYFIIFLTIVVVGCQSVPSPKKNDGARGTKETPQDVRSAVESVAGAISQNATRVKYCPVCGRRFSPSVTQCPDDGTVLKDLE